MSKCLRHMLPMGTSRPSRQKSFLEGQYDGKVLPALEGRAISAYWLSCNKSSPEGLPALSEEHKRDSTRWDETVGVSEGFDHSSSPGITKENTPSLLHSQSARKPSTSRSGSSIYIPWKQVSHLTAQLLPGAAAWFVSAV